MLHLHHRQAWNRQFQHLKKKTCQRRHYHHRLAQLRR